MPISAFFELQVAPVICVFFICDFFVYSKLLSIFQKPIDLNHIWSFYMREYFLVLLTHLYLFSKIDYTNRSNCFYEDHFHQKKFQYVTSSILILTVNIQSCRSKCHFQFNRCCIKYLTESRSDQF